MKLADEMKRRATEAKQRAQEIKERSQKKALSKEMLTSRAEKMLEAKIFPEIKKLSHKGETSYKFRLVELDISAEEFHNKREVERALGDVLEEMLIAYGFKISISTDYNNSYQTWRPNYREGYWEYIELFIYWP